MLFLRVMFRFVMGTIVRVVWIGGMRLMTTLGLR
jgi:hypothetical protein